MISRILIVGLGSIGKRHLRVARELLPNADIRVLRHQLTNEIPEYSNGCFFEIEEAINFLPQIAVIANPAPFHIAAAQALSEHRIHLLVEKPLSSSLDGVAKLIATCKKYDVTLVTGYNLRFSLSLNRFRDLLNEGVIGKILSVRCEIGQYLPSWRPNDDYRKGVSARSELGGGVLLELSHELDYLHWIFGDIEWVNATLSRQSDLDINVEDTAHITLGFFPKPNLHQLIGVVNLDFIRHDTTRICTAIGDKGSLRWNGLSGQVDIFKPKEKDWTILINKKELRDESYHAEWNNFIECVLEKKSPVVKGEDGLEVLEIIEAVKKSASSGQRVFLVPTTQLKGSGE